MEIEKRVLNLDRLEYEDRSRGEHYGKRVAMIGKDLGAEKLGFHVEVLPPGAFSYPYHFHHAQEELFLVLEGRAMLRYDGQYREVARGDLVHCPVGSESAHQFHNHTREPFRMLALSSRSDVEVCEYPDSGKVLATGADAVFRREDRVEYLDGEEEPGRNWPEGTS